MTSDHHQPPPIGQSSEIDTAPPDALSSGKLFLDSPTNHHAPLVLIATQQLQVRAIGTTILRAAGFRIATETHGETIVKDLGSLQPDLILTDLELDDMHAGRLCERLRELRHGQNIPVLVISDLVDTEILQQVLTFEFTDVTSAPVNWKVLTFRIHRWISLTRKFNSQSDHELDLAQVRDSALKASTELLQLRNYDSVTGLPNREMFLSTAGLLLSQNLRSSGYLAVLYLDIDEFKAVNDLIGRSLGDELLRVIAKRLQGCLRDGDLVSQVGNEGAMASFARLNGDQFAILLSSVQNQDGATAVAKRLLASISRPLTIRDRQFRLAARIGISDSSNIEDESEETLVQRAETAMRYCKQRVGKTYAFFEGFMNELVRKKLELKEELRQALDQNQLYLCYQFLVDSRSTVPKGVEGLIRWQHPNRGFVSPGEFMPVAEESELILEIDRWVLRTGCRQGKFWLDSGFPPLLISLNVSMRFLEEDDFADQVLAIVDESGLPPATLQLELSERGTLPEAERIMPQFEKLVARGIHLALDDFGTGQTSLSYLRTLPISCVKVDRAFVRRIPDDSASMAIVTAIVAMSHHLGLKVVAEGVETEEQWRFLSEQNYDELQGFLFSRPERVEILEKVVRELGEWQQPSEALPQLDQAPRSLTPQQPPLQGSAPVDPAAPSTAAPSTAANAAALSRPGLSPNPAEEPLGAPPTPGAPLSGTPLSGTLLSGTLPPDLETQADPSRLGKPSQTNGSADPVAAKEPGSWKESEDHLLQLARQDFLTKLFNRFSFDERLEHAVAHADRYGHKVALLLIDLDDFKYVNDTHGHAVGDSLLIALAERLQSLVRKVDTLARIGGDEFAVILSEINNVENVAEFAGRFLTVLSQPLQVESRELRVTGSLGVSVYPAGNTQTKDLLRQADLALYRAKAKGGNSVRFFAHEMDRELQRGLALAQDLEGAVERGELFLVYQLQVALATGAIAGVEALVRWGHPKLGLITPDQFIPIAESTGEIRSIGRWVIQSACAEAKKWQQSTGRNIRVSVNISVVQCRDSSFVETTLQALQEHKLTPQMLDLELNEKLLNHLPQDLEDTLRQLGKFGVGLTLDDFGSGSSALEHFQRFRFDRVKIHQSLVRTIGDAFEPASVLSGILALASKMNVEIIAEGIEHPEEATVLAAEGCAIGQGFLFSKPLAPEPLARLMSRWDSDPPSSIRAIQTAPVQAGLAQAVPAQAGPAQATPTAGATTELFTSGLPDIDLQLSDDPAVARAIADMDPSVGPSTPPTDPTESPLEMARSELRKRYSHAASVGGRKTWKRRWGLLVASTALVAVALAFLPYYPSQGTAEIVSAEALSPQTPASMSEPASSSPRAAPQKAPAIVPPPPTRQEMAAQQPAQPADGPPLEAFKDLAQTWARAWSEQRVRDYLKLYAADFRPPQGMSRSAWEAQRTQRILKPRHIEVELRAVEARQQGGERVAVSFDQIYRSESYQDTVRKTLELVAENGDWKILAEYSDE